MDFSKYSSFSAIDFVMDDHFISYVIAPTLSDKEAWQVPFRQQKTTGMVNGDHLCGSSCYNHSWNTAINSLHIYNGIWSDGHRFFTGQ
ncbi:MAG: hypothetical protein LW630_11950 [Saprospiraceae bacterium]|nr:hypothetical protein [Saprospiraceae bacterium]